MADNLLSVSEYSLSCSICLDLFVNPRTLPCLHSFCHLCLFGYIESTLNKKGDSFVKGFHCPCCRLFIVQPDEDLDLNTWLHSLPVNSTLVSIMDSIKENKTTSVKSVYCGECGRQGSEGAAEVHCMECDVNLCRKCQEIHALNMSLSGHKLYCLKLIPEGQHVIGQLRDIGMCRKHPAVQVKFLCTDHQKYCCSECVIEKHRHCQKLVPTEEKIEASSEATRKEVQEMRDIIIGGCDILLDFGKRCSETLETSSKKTTSDIQEITQLMHNYVYALGRRLTDQVVQAEKTTEKRIRDNTDKLIIMKEKISRSEQLVETAKQHGSKHQNYFANLDMKQCLEEVEEDLRESFKVVSEKEMNLTGLSGLSVNALQLLNSINVQMEDTDNELPKYTGSSPLHTRNPVLRTEMCMDNYGNIDGCEWISSDVIVIAERDMKRLSLIDIKNRTAVDRASFPSAPWQLTKIDQSTVAASFPNEKKVRIVKASRTNIVSGWDIDVSGVCHGLAYRNEEGLLMVLLRDQGKIAQFHLDGSRAQTIPVNGTIASDIRNAYCMAYNSELRHIYISCHNTHKVVAINMQGAHLFTYTWEHCKGPWGVTCDTDYNIYICWFGSSNVHQIDKNGVFIREILSTKDNIKNPLIMTLNADVDSFVLTASENGKNMRLFKYI